MGCEHCADAARKGLKFCPSCGNALASFQPDPPVEREPLRGVVTKEKGTKTRKGLILALIVLLLAGGTYYGLATQFFTLEAKMKDIREAIRTNDATELAGHLEFNDQLVDSKQAERFLKALKETPKQEEALMDYLLLAGASIQSKNKSLVPAQVVQSGRQYGIFEDYRLRLSGVKTEVVSNFEGTKVTLLNPIGTETSKASDDGILIDGMYPGLTDAKVEYDGEYGKDADEVTINPLILDADDRTFEIELKGKAVKLDQTYPDGELIADGESTGETVSDLKTYGPVPKKGTVLSLTNMFPWGEETSKEVLVKPDTKTAAFTFEPSAATIDQIESAVDEHASDWVEAAESQDTSSFTLVDDAAYLAKQEKNYQSWSRSGKSWYGEVLNTSVDRTSATFVDYGGETGIEILATTYIRGELATDGSEFTGASTSKSVFRYLFTYSEMSESFRIQQAVNIK